MIKRSVIYFLILTAALYGLRYIHYKGLLKQQTGYYAKYKTAFLENNNFTVLFLGSSRVEMHYDTKYFDENTGQNSFNLSLAGATPHVAFAALKTYLESSKAPKYLLYEIDCHALSYKSEEVKEFNNYFPFLSSKTLRKEFSSIDPRMEHFYYNPYYSWPYTGLKNLSTGLHSWLNIPNKTDSLYFKGFVKEVFRPHLTYIPTKKQHIYFNGTERNYLDSIIQICREKGIKVSLITSPLFAGGNCDMINKSDIIKQINAIAWANGINYFDLSALPFCNDRKLFIDHFHLNYAGACKFSPYLVDIFNNKIAVTSLNGG